MLKDVLTKTIGDDLSNLDHLKQDQVSFILKFLVMLTLKNFNTGKIINDKNTINE